MHIHDQSIFFRQNVVKLILGNQSIVVSISSLNHLLKHHVILKLSQCFGHMSQFFNANIATFGCVESDENFMDLFSWFVFRWPCGHHSVEFVKFQHSAAIFVDFSDHLPNSLSSSLNTQRSDIILEFWYISRYVHLGSMVPPPSWSKRSKAFLIYKTSSTVTKSFTKG